MHPFGTLHVSVLCLLLTCIPQPTYATDEECLRSALQKMIGSFNAKGRAIGDDGVMRPFSQSYAVSSPASDTVIISSGGISYGRWQLLAGRYTFTGFNRDGSAKHAPVEVTYTCSHLGHSDTYILKEEWSARPGNGAEKWRYFQRRAISTDAQRVFTQFKEEGSNLPYYVYSVFEAAK
ncbi:hypothetical protein GPL17_18720 [Bradyrhizobium yuanmingense]|uniref:hypothetical protein n=1 Tax=Bradyrhizobium yuanmingense TaxID=108015 RepID=UPI0012F9BBC1|nr:hypothetical protein [Bradyrhizobium yuanmingense]MVT52517.1 hypothetical protein [Bradyrhizobium yuanmingense]